MPTPASPAHAPAPAPSARRTHAPAQATPVSAPAHSSPALQTGPPAVRLHPSLSSSGAQSVPGVSGGESLSPLIQGPLESSLQVNLQSVRVHTDSQAQAAAGALSARAFTVGSHIFLGRGEQATDLGLMGHEAAHVVQQQGTPALQRWSANQSDHYEHEAHQASAAVLRHESFDVHEHTGGARVQRLGISDALNYFADKANLIPGFRMFTIILGVNPINMSRVAASPANILRAVIELLPGIGTLITQALDNSGVFEKVANWFAGQIKTLGMVGSSIKQAITNFLNSLGWRDIFDLGGVWARAKRIFTDPIDRIIAFARGLVDGIIQFVKDAILKPIAKLAEGTNGYNLLKAVLGKDPITGEAVPQTAEAIICPFMKLIGQEEIWENMKKANAIPRAFAWFKGALSGLMGFVRQIPGLFLQAFRSLELADIVWFSRAFTKLVKVFGGFLIQFTKWAGGTLWTLLEIIFEVVSPAALRYIKKTGAALKSILKNPLPFVRNLVKAAKLGFENFADHFTEHLKTGLIDWLAGSLEGVYIPKALNLLELGKCAISVLGVSWAQIRGKIIKALGPSGETIMKVMETVFNVVVVLVNGGPAAVWELIKEKLNDLKDQVVNGIISLVTDTVIKKAVPKLIAMFIPGAGFISAILSIYDTVMVFVEKISQIIQVVTAFIDSIVSIAAGDIGAATKRVESILGRLLSLAISFLAGFLGLGKVTDKIKEVIEKVRGKVDKALDAAIAWIVDKAKKLYGKAKAAVGKVIEWWKAKKPFTTKGGQSHEISFSGDEKKAVPMVASKERKTVQAKLDEFYKQACGKQVSPEEKSGKDLIEKTRNDAKKDPNDPNLVQNVQQLFEKYDESDCNRETKIFRKTGTLGPDTVGLEMSIDWLGAKHKTGTPPQSNAQTKLMGRLVTDKHKRSSEKYIRGHLLNENLGGKGDCDNLFPITGNANSQHLHSTEAKIKNWVKEKHNWVFYEVKVKGVSSRLQEDENNIPYNYVNCTLSCHAIRKDKMGEKKEEFSSEISSIFLVKQKAEVKEQTEEEKQKKKTT